MPSPGYGHRPVAYGARGLVAAAHPAAALAGLDTLRAGDMGDGTRPRAHGGAARERAAPGRGGPIPAGTASR
jgi:hypothetical protein